MSEFSLGSEDGHAFERARHVPERPMFEHPLHEAASLGDLDQVVSLILQNPAHIHAETTPSKETPLHIAAQYGHFEVVEALLSNQANVLAEDSLGRRPLETALHPIDIPMSLRRDRDDTILMLLKSMTEEQVVQQTGPSRLPVLCTVSAQNYVKSLQWILQYSTTKSVLGETRHGRTLLYDIIALGYEHTEVAMLLLNHSAPIKGTSLIGNTALHFAAEAGMSAVVEALLHDGSSYEPPIPEALSIHNSRGHRPLECACAFYDPRDPGDPADAARWRASERTIIFLLWQDSLSVPIPEVDLGWTALHWAVFYNRPYLVSLLVSRGADVQARDYSQRTPVDLASSVASSSRRSEMMQWLQPRDTEVSGREHGVVFSLTRPRSTPEVEMLLARIPFYIADVYRGASLETSGFSLRSLLYEFGPSHIMNLVENQAAEELVSEKDDFALRWIHLPANNVSAGHSKT